MAAQHGGERPGAGRPSNAVRHAEPIAKAGDRLAGVLPDITEALIDIALGRGFEETWEPAGTVTFKDFLRIKDMPEPEPDPEADPLQNPDPEAVWLDPKGKPVPMERSLYPHLPANELVLVQQKPWKPDIRAIQEAHDRLIGKAIQALSLSNGEDGPLKIQVVYADPPSDPAEASPGPGEDPPGEAAI